MTQLEYLVLEGAVSSASGYSHFVFEHEFTEEKVATTIMNLLSREEIFIYWQNITENPKGLHVKSSLSEDEFFAGLHHQRGVILVTYALTQKGAARWEELTKPRWERFFQHRNYLYDEKKLSLLA